MRDDSTPPTPKNKNKNKNFSTGDWSVGIVSSSKWILYVIVSSHFLVSYAKQKTDQSRIKQKTGS